MNKKLSESNYHILILDLLHQGRTVKISVRGMSMFPFLLTNDVVLVKPVVPADLKFGQLIVYKTGDNWVVHRLVGKNNNKGLVYTRGDGLARKDKPIKSSDVIGVVVSIEQSRGKLAKIAIGRWSPFLAFISPVTAPVFRVVVKILGYLKR